jgi:hypothetical protein
MKKIILLVLVFVCSVFAEAEAPFITGAWERPTPLTPIFSNSSSFTEYYIGTTKLGTSKFESRTKTFLVDGIDNKLGVFDVTHKVSDGKSIRKSDGTRLETEKLTAVTKYNGVYTADEKAAVATKLTNENYELDGKSLKNVVSFKEHSTKKGTYTTVKVVCTAKSRFK